MQKRENRKRYIQKLIRLTPEEDRQIKTAMAQMGVPSFQYYAKNQLVQGKVVQIDFSELKDLRVAINRVGTNINQIAKLATRKSGDDAWSENARAFERKRIKNNAETRK